MCFPASTKAQWLLQKHHQKKIQEHPFPSVFCRCCWEFIQGWALPLSAALMIYVNPVLRYRVLHLLFKSFCPSESGIICWMCVFPSSRPLVKAAIRIKPRAHREEGLVALICCSLREKSSSSALALVSEGHNILQWPASTCVPVSAFHPIFPMQLLNLVQANLAKV